MSWALLVALFIKPNFEIKRTTMKLREITQYLESIAPLAYQESYDNSGLIVGDPNAEVTGVLLSLDSTEDVLDEAMARGCNLIISHHPIVFSGLKKITGRTYIERVVIKAIRNNLNIYAIHTNLDNVHNGVNARICDRLGLTQTQTLSPKKGILRKLYTFCPTDQAEQVRQALFSAGAGHIGEYDSCSFNTEGTGTFRAGADSNPYIGEVGELHRESETKIEVIFPAAIQSKVIGVLQQAHPYEEVAYDLVALENKHSRVGAGMVGELVEPMSEVDFLQHLKGRMEAAVVRHTALLDRPIKRVAVCGGSGSFLLNQAMAAGAQVFVTADYKYHQFFDADGKIVIADIGHYETEHFTQELLHDLLTEKFATFAVHLSDTNTNPIKYL